MVLFYLKNRMCYMIKILILGTSNSILHRGWTYGLRKILPEADITNKSIGASTGIQFSTLYEMDFSYYDYVFFDSIPNDQEYFSVKNDEIYYSFFSLIIKSIMEKISLQSNLIVLCVNRKEFLQEEKNDFIYTDRLFLSSELGAFFIDIKTIINYYINKYEISKEIMYDCHPSHPEMSFMYNIGNSIGKLILENNINKEKFKITSEFKSIYSNSSFLKKFESKRFKNSLINEEFFILDNENCILFDNNRDYIIGFYINARNTNCFVSIQDENQKKYSISLCYGNSEGILKLFVPIPKMIKVSKLVVKNKIDFDEELIYTGIGVIKSNEIKTEETILTLSSFSFFKDEINIVEKNLNRLEDNNITDKIMKKMKNKKFFFARLFQSNNVIESFDFFDKQINYKNKIFTIITGFDTFLCYDIREKKITHQEFSSIEDSTNFKILIPEFDGEIIKFFIFYGENKIKIKSYIYSYYYNQIIIKEDDNNYMSCIKGGGIEFNSGEISRNKIYNIVCAL